MKMQPDKQDLGAGRELNAWLQSYRESCQAPEPSAHFMPRLWERIESRNRLVLLFRRWTEGFVVAGAAACLGIVVMQGVEDRKPKPVNMSYVEALASENEPDRLVLQDVAMIREVRPANPNPADHTLP